MCWRKSPVISAVVIFLSINYILSDSKIIINNKYEIHSLCFGCQLSINRSAWHAFGIDFLTQHDLLTMHIWRLHLLQVARERH